MRPEGPNRRLAAILAADVVGYSRLMAEDEAATIRTLATYREEVGLLVRHHRGRVVDFTGDNFLAEFPTALDGAQAALEIQRVIRARNADLKPDRRMEFRIGVHLGDVAVEGDRIYGDGVNIAARLQGLADPGAICVSGEVHGQVHHKLDLACDDLGEQSVKNIPDPVRVYRLRPEASPVQSTASSRSRTGLKMSAALGMLLLALGGWALWSRYTGPSRSPADTSSEFTVPGFGGRPAIAVLPFDNLSGDPDQEYFADGVAEDVITRLSLGGRFPVIARNSSFTYKGRSVDVKQVSRELGARYVVEGSVRKAGDRVRITAQLIDATTGHHVWAETYDRELRDIFALQDEIAQAISSSAEPGIWKTEMARAARAEPRNLDAYGLNLRGVWHLSKYRAGDNLKARAFFQKAAEMDPHYPAPLSYLAFTHYYDVLFGWTDSPARSVAGLQRAARACLEVNETFWGCQMAIGAAYGLTGQRDKEVAAYERAVRLNPSNALAHAGLGNALGWSGRPDEGIARLQLARRLSPRDPSKHSFMNGIAGNHFVAGRYEESVDWAQRALRERPTPWGYVILASSHARLGQSEEARAAVRDLLQMEPEFSQAVVRGFLLGTDPEWLDLFVSGLHEAGLPE